MDLNPILCPMCMHCYRLSDPFMEVKMDINDDVFVYLMEKETMSNINQHNNMMIYEVYKNQEGGSPIFNEYGAWFEEAEIFEHTDLDKYMRRRNLQVRTTSPKNTTKFDNIN